MAVQQASLPKNQENGQKLKEKPTKIRGSVQAGLQNRTHDRDSDRARTAGARPQHSGELPGEHVEIEVEVVIFESYATNHPTD